MVVSEYSVVASLAYEHQDPDLISATLIARSRLKHKHQPFVGHQNLPRILAANFRRLACHSIQLRYRGVNIVEFRLISYSQSVAEWQVLVESRQLCSPLYPCPNRRLIFLLLRSLGRCLSLASSHSYIPRAPGDKWSESLQMHICICTDAISHPIVVAAAYTKVGSLRRLKHVSESSCC